MDSPGRHLHLDPIGGIAGDMFVAAALDAMPDLTQEAKELAAGIGPGVGLELEPARDHGLTGKRLTLTLPGPERGPRHYPDYVDVLVRAAPDPGVAERACDILRRLGEAEAAVHGVPLDKVHFHEISDWDSIADILLAAWALERMNIVSASVGPLPIGSGRVETEHGILPVPAPATLHLLQGMTVIDDGIPGERITPTGAAILAHLAPDLVMPGRIELKSAGYGFGTRQFDKIANLLRLSVYETTSYSSRDRVGFITFHIDDQTPEDLAVGLDNLRSRPEVLDVLQIPGFGKKGRLTACIEVLCELTALEDVAKACFLETTTIGLRLHCEDRLLLRRSEETVEVDGVAVCVKRSWRPGGTTTAKPESDEIATAGDRAARDHRRLSVENSLNDETGSAQKRDPNRAPTTKYSP